MDPRDRRPLRESMKEDQLWYEIRQAARQDPLLQRELDRVLLYYRLRKQHGKS